MKSHVCYIAVLVLISINIVTGLICYSCEGHDYDMCGREPTRANRVSCVSNEICNVLRTERSDSFGKTVTISRGCRQSAFAGAVAGNGVGVSTSSQSCSTDLCNTGDGLGPSINFPGFNANNGFGFSSGSNTNFHSSAPGGMNYNPLLIGLLGLISSILAYAL